MRENPFLRDEGSARIATERILGISHEMGHPTVEHVILGGEIAVRDRECVLPPRGQMRRFA